MTFSWIDKPGFEKYLKGDIALIAQLFGMNGVIKMLHNFSGSNIYVTTDSIKVLHPVYMVENPHLTVKQLSRLFGTSEMYIYNLRKNINQQNNFKPKR